MKRILFILLFAILFQSCKIGKNYKGTEFVQPDSYAQEAPEMTVAYDSVNTDSLELSTADLLWWKLYDDPVLDSLISTALANNRDVLIAAENVLQGRLALKIQNAEMLPKFDVQGQVQRGNFLLNQVGDPQNLILGAASANWELDLWGKLRRLSEAARADLVASEYGYRGVMISLISEVATTYFNLLRAKSQYEISMRNATSRDSMLQLIQARYDKGIVPIIDVDQATIQYTIAAGAVPQYEREIVRLENTLSILIGQNPGPIPTGKLLSEQKYEIDLPVARPVDLLTRRPDVIASEYQLIAQNAQVGAAKGNRLPTISASALVGIAADSFGNLSFDNPLWTLTGQLAGPLFYWGQLKRQVDIEDSRRYQALYQYQNTVFFALKEVEDVLAEIRTTRDEIAIAERRREAALQAQTLSRERYNMGVTSYLEFLEQQRQAFDAELLLEGLRANLLSAHVRLYKALGGGWLSEEEQQAAQNAE
ncbi:MAG: efflux transporter outer membrane subunit [Bacteroidetes bacterium]|jgi:multidrug efflux system outer membrane protein|nr:MAG: efflux transporter outer membrane subunit [Bacteroidota bacterium]UCE70304.1 MAG: efflux transporter outer membrane subunit [Flavobacteriaceae bacterium]